MKINLKLILNKDNEAEMSYCKILDMSLASYNLMTMLHSELPELKCESCDCGSEVEYRIECEQDVTIEDIEKLLKNAIADGSINA